jgi:hypothetical protein
MSITRQDTIATMHFEGSPVVGAATLERVTVGLLCWYQGEMTWPKEMPLPPLTRPVRLTSDVWEGRVLIVGSCGGRVAFRSNISV